jgi:hypothetical protein
MLPHASRQVCSWRTSNVWRKNFLSMVLREISPFAAAGLIGCILFAARNRVGRFATKIGFPPFYPGDERKRVRLFGMIGICWALIGFGAVGISLISSL